MIDIDKIEAAAHETINDDIENFMLMLPDHMLEMVALIRKQREVMQQALTVFNYQRKPLCMCWAGCDECDPATAPDPDAAIRSLENALK
jgi:hypothetical protein